MNKPERIGSIGSLLEEGFELQKNPVVSAVALAGAGAASIAFPSKGGRPSRAAGRDRDTREGARGQPARRG